MRYRHLGACFFLHINFKVLSLNSVLHLKSGLPESNTQEMQIEQHRCPGSDAPSLEMCELFWFSTLIYLLCQL